MTLTSGGCRDLRKYQEDPRVVDAFSKLVSGGKVGYKAIIEKKVEEIRCKNCSSILEGNEKFCSNCGTKTEWQKKMETPIKLLTLEELEKKFKNNEEKESEILAYMRDLLKIQDSSAFELITKWRKEINSKKDSIQINLDQFKG